MESLYRGNSSKADITMIVETPQYQRTMQMTSTAIGEEQSFIRILTPKKDRGISTLKLDQEMWNYFPRSTRSSRCSFYDDGADGQRFHQR